tara:strand:- start:168 stop:365 length:198 start_codon:yes stop_codon:yes gene_type:complete
MKAKQNKYGHIEIFDKNENIEYLQIDYDIFEFLESLSKYQKNNLLEGYSIIIKSNNIYYDHLLNK